MFVESFTNVTILFSDICSYTTLAASVEPQDVVTMLNHVYRWVGGGAAAALCDARRCC
jgi:class 3 adenylate cyclase